MSEEAVPYFEAACSACSWSQLCGPEGMSRLMLAAGRLKRDSQLDLAMLGELFRASAGHLSCPSCGAKGLKLKCRSDLNEGWPIGRPCTACGKMLPEERLALFPNATLCAACQERVDRNESVGETEYCPRCGCPMRLRLSRGGGLTRYEMVCTASPPCRIS